jgi:hypothetical protein
MFYGAIETLDNNWKFREFVVRMFGGDADIKFRSIITDFNPPNENAENSPIEPPF